MKIYLIHFQSQNVSSCEICLQPECVWVQEIRQLFVVTRWDVRSAPGLCDPGYLGYGPSDGIISVFG